MSFATAVEVFAHQAARERRSLTPACVQPLTDQGTRDGELVVVFLSAVRAEREITENGFVIIHRAQLRVVKSCRWHPAEGSEFEDTATRDRFRCATATGGSSAFAAEIVCDVVRISP